MIKLMLIEDKENKINLMNSFYGRVIDGAVVALLVDNEIAGIINYTMNKCAYIKAVYIIENKRGYGYGDFLIRSTLNMLAQSGFDIVIEYVDEKNYYSKFNFKLKNSKLTVKSSDLVFPSKCKECKINK